MTDHPPSSLVKIKGKWYVNLTIPQELREHFRGQKQLRLSTSTSDETLARRRQHDLTARLYARLDAAQPHPLQKLADLLEMPLAEVQDLSDEGQIGELVSGRMILPMVGDPEEDLAIQSLRDRAANAMAELETLRARSITPSDTVSLSGAIPVYMESNPYAKHKTAKDAENALNEFLSYAGDVTLDSVTSVKGYEFAEHLGQTKGSKTIAKKIAYIRKMFDHYVRKGTIPSNPFKDLSIPRTTGTAKKSYRPFTLDELGDLFSLDMKPHIKLLLSILITSGMRLDEAALLNWEDIKEENGITYYDLTDRRDTVKNIGSARKVPVHPVLSDVVVTGRTGQIFPEFKRDRDGKAQASASKACMAQIRKVTSDRTKVVHSLRGNFKDMLRDAEVSKEVNDFITGHGSGDVAGTYGDGPTLAMRHRAISKLDLPFIVLNQ